MDDSTFWMMIDAAADMAGDTPRAEVPQTGHTIADLVAGLGMVAIGVALFWVAMRYSNLR